MSEDNASQPGATCHTCQYFRQQDKGGGNCHRYPPVFAGDASPIEGHRWKFPFVFGRNWCGEHKGYAEIQSSARENARE